MNKHIVLASSLDKGLGIKDRGAKLGAYPISILTTEEQEQILSFLADNYPLAYVRSSAEENILVIINPSAAPAVLSAEELCALNKELLYTVGGTVKEDANHALQVDGGTAAFISLTK